MRTLTAEDVIAIASEVTGLSAEDVLTVIDREAVKRGIDAVTGDDVIAAGSALLHTLLRERPLRAGSDRLAVLAALQLLGLNGYALDLTPAEEIAGLVQSIRRGEMSPADVASWMSARVARGEASDVPASRPPFSVRLRYYLLSARVPEQWVDWAARDILAPGYGWRVTLRSLARVAVALPIVVPIIAVWSPRAAVWPLVRGGVAGAVLGSLFAILQVADIDRLRRRDLLLQQRRITWLQVGGFSSRRQRAVFLAACFAPAPVMLIASRVMRTAGPPVRLWTVVVLFLAYLVFGVTVIVFSIRMARRSREVVDTTEPAGPARR